MNAPLQHTQTRKARFTMTAIILIPIFFTMAMWMVLPSGYRRFISKKETKTTISNWQPLQAGLKQIVFAWP